MGVLAGSELESRRFGVKIARARLDHVDFSALDAEIQCSDLDLAIIRVPAGTCGVEELSDPTIHADTLVYYRLDLENHVPAPMRNTHLVFRRARSEDAADLEILIRHAFADYSSNPALDPALILAGYEEWGRGFIDPIDASSTTAGNRSVTLALDQGRPVGFLAWEQRGDEVEIVLNGVSPTHSGSGLYSDLVRGTQQEAKEQGASHMLVSTQVQNFAVQKVWGREGFHMFQAWDTHHVLAWNSAGELAFDDEVRLAEGETFVQRVSRLLADGKLGRESVVLAEATQHLRPVRANASYRLRMKLLPDPAHPRTLVIAHLRDHDSTLVAKSRVSVHAAE